MSKPTIQAHFDPNDKLAVFLRLMSYLRPYWGAWLLMGLGMVISAGSEVASAKMFQFIIDAINADDKVGKFWFPFLVIGLFVCRGVGAFLGGYYSAY
ncbi:MAG: lipid ABC transporter permease/ATP-binding protein, partial [Moraxella sp.]|nr:lipid ABC transporter permease/ATP-binding protein [Moraxella sp.]